MNYTNNKYSKRLPYNSLSETTHTTKKAAK